MPRKKKKAERTFLQKYIGDSIGKYLDSQKDAISRAIRDRDRAKAKFADLDEKLRKHRAQCDKYVRREFCDVCSSINTDIDKQVDEIVNLEEGIKRAQQEGR